MIGYRARTWLYRMTRDRDEPRTWGFGATLQETFDIRMTRLRNENDHGDEKRLRNAVDGVLALWCDVRDMMDRATNKESR
jgi:hypothetical protein